MNRIAALTAAAPAAPATITGREGDPAEARFILVPMVADRLDEEFGWMSETGFLSGFEVYENGRWVGVILRDAQGFHAEYLDRVESGELLSATPRPVRRLNIAANYLADGLHEAGRRLAIRSKAHVDAWVEETNAKNAAYWAAKEATEKIGARRR